MSRSVPSPLQRAFDRLAEALCTKDAARRWYERYLATLASRAVVDTSNAGAITWVHRRAAGSRDVLPLPTVHRTRAQVGGKLLEGIEIADGRQRLKLFYDDAGRIADRSMFDGRVGDAVRQLVADGFAGTALGMGRTPDEALAAYAAEVARAFPEPRPQIHSITDDYDDDDGNLISPGEVPPELREPAPPSEASTVIWQPDTEEEGASWRGEPGEGSSGVPPAPQVDPITGRVDFGTFVMRGPSSDAPPLPRRPECLPHVVLPLDASPDVLPPRGRWVRVLGELGVTRHVVRIEERDGFVLVGADLLGILDLKALRSALDRIDARDPPPTPRPEHERYVRYRARQYRWVPGTATRPEGLAVASSFSGPHFDAGGLDGDALQAMVHRHRRVKRPPA